MTPDPALAVETWPWSLTPKRAKHCNLYNVAVAFEHDPALQSLVWYDSFLDRILTGAPPREWTDADDVRWAIYLQDTYGLHGISPTLVHDLVSQRAHDRARHAVLDWLTPIVWDGTPRITTAFATYWSADITPDQPQDYLDAISRNFFLGLAARVLKPGCQLDTVVVFEGPQGIGKTSALRVLGGRWYAQAHDSVAKRDFFEGLQGKWLIEIGELDAFSRAEVTRVKTAISTPIDRYRAPYARAAIDRPRQCVFAGTTNADEWGHDETGLRRFWPVRCGPVDLSGLARDRDQLCAEAVARVTAGESWWNVPTSAAAVQHDRQLEHPWTATVVAWITGKTEVTIPDILLSGLKIPDALVKVQHAHEVGRILTLAGWTKRNLKREGRQRKIWTPRDTLFEPSADEGESLAI